MEIGGEGALARYKVCSISELVQGTNKRVEISGVAICLTFAVDGNVYALNDECTHEGVSLSEGDLIGFEVECPGHLSRFDFRTGAVTGLPATQAAQVYKVVVEDGDVWVDM